MSTLTQKLNEYPVILRLTAHGGIIPAGSHVVCTSNAPDVATVGAPDYNTPYDQQMLDFAVVQNGVGATDIHHTCTFPDGTVYEDTCTLILDAAPNEVTDVTSELFQVKPPSTP